MWKMIKWLRIHAKTEFILQAATVCRENISSSLLETLLEKR